ncbi:hypothetical protein E2C01_036278 [Portunus trituberculatus]|uniref:Uncharacterized protein n=1 Tax=Portunus trituberculatus TaxID=210409 RepID=A0A5B7F8B3_PORTR|nr:hypothetical protein [Portunus trituberculatus]
MSSLLRQCETCRGRFAPQYFRNSSTCRLCHLQSTVERLNDKYKKCKQCDGVMQQIQTLNHFVVCNTGCTSANSVLAICDGPVSATPRAPTVPMPGQLSESCGRARRSRKRLGMPGGRRDNITAACDEATSRADGKVREDDTTV